MHMMNEPWVSDEREDFPRDDEGRYLYRCEIDGIPFNSRREADLCAAVKDWDIFYGTDTFLHPNNDFDKMYGWTDE